MKLYFCLYYSSAIVSSIAFVLRACNFCKEYTVLNGGGCSFLDKIRPCDQMFGIDAYKTVWQQGLPCEILHHKEYVQNRYGFLLIDYLSLLQKLFATS